MPVTSPTVQTDFHAQFQTGKLASARPPLVAVPNKNYVQTLNDTDDNEAKCIFAEHRSSTAHIKYEIRQKETGRISVNLDFAASTPEEFHAVLAQVAGGIAAVSTKATSDNWRDNSLPTLTSFSGAAATVAAETETEITLAELKAVGNEADGDGTVDAFVVQAVSTGTLKIGPDAETAKAFAAETNDTIDSNNKAYWTSAEGATSTVNAFTVKAKDNDDWLSASAVQVTVTIS